MTSLSHFHTLGAELQAFGRMLPALPRFRPAAPWSASSLLSERANANPDALGLAFEDRRYSWREIDAEVDRYASALQRWGVGPGDVVPLLMDNRPEFLFALTAISRLRAIAALINTNVTGSALVHAIHISSPQRVLVGCEHAEKVAGVLADLEGVGTEQVAAIADGENSDGAGFQSFDAMTEANAGPPEPVGAPRTDERMCYIYTSGTTGLPKAAIVKNVKFVMAGSMFGRGLLGLGPKDIIYLTLPLYHSNGVFGGWGAALNSGAAIALRRKFSASRFWSDVRKFDATAFVYIGELCRYLLNQPESPEDGQHRLHTITGNGLRPDIWQRFQERFRIPTIREFYGATEGNGMLVNLAGRAGMIGRRIPGMALARCDLASGEMHRGDDGFAQEIAAGETGLALMKITGVSAFDGYVDPAATEKKVFEDVFQKGDRYFNTGDLIELHERGWLSFADRVGDTFRWKGENVSTNEVAELLNGAPGVLESNVFGVAVPGADGRAGMACLNCREDFDVEKFSAFVGSALPGYQRPYFLRLLKEMRITGTFKHQKTDYKKEAYDPTAVSDPLFYFDGDRYVPLDEPRYRDIQEQRIALR